MLRIVGAILSLLPFTARGMKILIFGDSFDRFMAIERCESQGKKHFAWSDDKLTYYDGEVGALRCESGPDDTVTHLQVFGSNATIPYFLDKHMMTPTNLVNTKDRINYAFRLYMKSYPPPDVLLFHSLSWDVQFFSTQGDVWFTVNTIGHDDFNRAITNMRQAFIERMAELRALLVEYRVENITRLGVRSGFYYPSRYSSTRCEKDVKFLIEAYNDVYRTLARENNWLFFDLDANVWSTTRYAFSGCEVMRDHIHTSPFFSIIYGKKLTGARHTPFYWFRGDQPAPADWPSSWRHPKTHRVLKEVYLVKIAPSQSLAGWHHSDSSPHNITTDYARRGDFNDHRTVPGTSLKYFANSTLAAQYLLEEEQFAQDLYFVSYDKTGQKPLLHKGAGVHFQRLFVLGEGDIYVATAAELQDLRVGHDVPQAMNVPEVWQRGVIVHIPSAKTSNSTDGSTSHPTIHRTTRRHLRHRRRTTGADTVEQLPETLAIYGENVDAPSSTGGSGGGTTTIAANVEPFISSAATEGYVSVCDEWYLLLRGRKYPLHLIPDFADRCRDSLARSQAGRHPLNRIYERFEKVTQLAGLERCRVHERDFLSLLVDADVVHVP